MKHLTLVGGAVLLAMTSLLNQPIMANTTNEAVNSDDQTVSYKTYEKRHYEAAETVKESNKDIGRGEPRITQNHDPYSLVVDLRNKETKKHVMASGLEVMKGYEVQIYVAENPSTGFIWHVDEGHLKGLFQVTSHYMPNTNKDMVGAPGARVFNIWVKDDRKPHGTRATLTMVLARAHEQVFEQEDFNFNTVEEDKKVKIQLAVKATPTEEL